MEIKEKEGKFYLDGVEIEELFPIEYWDSPDAFYMSGIKGYEPMTAKELETEEEQNNCFNSADYIIEEKFDGTRALVYFLGQEDVEGNEEGFCRVFSRRISKKTGFYVENTDSLPHIRETNKPELKDTILDGEMFINNLPFKEVSSTLNCLWDKAVSRQIEKGFITFHAFDILFYKGVDLRKMNLERRKEYLRLAVEETENPYIECVEYFSCGSDIKLDLINEITRRGCKDSYYNKLYYNRETYKELYDCWKNHSPLSPKTYYELIVSTGGEGVIIKHKKGKYLHKRGWEYSKIKKFLTKELVIIGFSEPTKEYGGKDIKKWAFWVEEKTDKRVQGNYYGNNKYLAVTKSYYYKQVGNLLLGIYISKEDYEKMPDNKKGNIIKCDNDKYLMEVCECSGFDEEIRNYFTRNKNNMIGSVVEVKANEIFKDSGKLRHPRYMRLRPDKNNYECTWDNHINGD